MTYINDETLPVNKFNYFKYAGTFDSQGERCMYLQDVEIYYHGSVVLVTFLHKVKKLICVDLEVW